MAAEQETKPHRDCEGLVHDDARKVGPLAEEAALRPLLAQHVVRQHQDAHQELQEEEHGRLRAVRGLVAFLLHAAHVQGHDRRLDLRADLVVELAEPLAPLRAREAREGALLGVGGRAVLNDIGARDLGVDDDLGTKSTIIHV